jgi:phosphotransferase system enzyme I (PtsI)
MLFMNRREMPEEEEQFHAYATMQQAISPHPLTIRTLDAGGDKLLEGLPQLTEQNPALGMRAIRLSLSMRDEFKKQLRAILRVSALGNVRIMFPMISGLDELRRAKSLLEECKSELLTAGIPFDSRIQVGIMVEIPSAVMMADVLAPEADFFSIGTNDLIQYTLAIDRADEAVAHLYDPWHPAVLQLLHQTIQRANAMGRGVSVCGEMAGDSAFTELLLAMGLRSFSMHPARISAIKQRVLRADTRQLVNQLPQVLASDHPAETLRLLQGRTAH